MTVPDDDRGFYAVDLGESVLPVRDQAGAPLLVAIPSHGGEWRLYDAWLNPRGTVPFSQPDAERPQTAFGPAWPLVPAYAPEAGAVTLRDPTRRLQVVDTIPLRPEERCALGTTVTLAGDAETLIVICADGSPDSPVSVIPLPAR